MKSLLFSFCCFFIIHGLAAQNISLLDDIEVDRDIISVSITKKFDSKKNEIPDTLQKKITEELKVELAQKIMSKVEVQSSTSASQSNQSSNSSDQKKSNKNLVQKNDYYFISNISSSIMLQNPKIEFTQNKLAKTITGTISINTREFAQQNYNLLKSKAEKLMGLVDAVKDDQNTTSRVDQGVYNNIRQGNEEIKSLKELVSIYNNNLIKNDSVLQTNMQKIEQAEYILLTKIESEVFQTRLRKVSLLLTDKRYLEALDFIRLMIVDYPANESLIAQKKTILQEIENSYKSRLNNRDFLEILSAIEELELLDNYFIDKFSEEKLIFQKQAFNQYMEKAKYEFDNKQYDFASVALDKISKFKDFDIKKYSSLQKQINQALFNKEIEEVDQEISNGDYAKAFITLKNAQRHAFSESDNKAISSRDEEIVEKLTAQRIKEIKKIRPFTWQAQIGLSGITPMVATEAINVDQIPMNSVNPVLNFGIYRRLIHFDDIKTSNDIKGGSSLFGLRLSVWLPGSIRLGASTFNTPTTKINNPVIEPQVSIFMIRFFELNLGKLLNSFSDSTGISNNDFYSLALGIKPRMGHLHYNAGIKYISDLGKNNYLSIYFGFNIGANFKRKFKNSETSRVRSEVRNVLSNSYRRLNGVD